MVHNINLLPSVFGDFLGFILGFIFGLEMVLIARRAECVEGTLKDILVDILISQDFASPLELRQTV